MVINVEYNQLDPLLRATGFPDGDVNCETGYSPFPGNINQVISGYSLMLFMSFFKLNGCLLRLILFTNLIKLNYYWWVGVGKIEPNLKYFIMKPNRPEPKKFGSDLTSVSHRYIATSV